MNIKIVTVGKLKEKYLKAGIDEYMKRLKGYHKVEIIEVDDEKAPENLSSAERHAVKEKEGQKILAKIRESEHVIAMAIDGTLVSSEELAKEIEALGITGKSQLSFIIGGSLGLSEAVLKRANSKISFGRVTYPHQLMRLILVEQIYRISRINAGHAYHK